MSNGKSTKRGYVRLRAVAGSPGIWAIDFRDPETGARIRKRIHAATPVEAREVADYVSREVSAGRGFLAASGRFNPSVDTAMQEAIQASRGNLQTRRAYAYNARSFGRWLNEHKAGVAHWSEITTKIVKDYVDHCRALGLSNDQARLRLYVVKATARYMAATYGGQFPDVAGPVRFVREQENPHKAQERERAKALPAEALLAFLDFLQERRTDLHAIACLQGLCGLRAMEAANIREQDIDFAAGTVRIDETPDHRPKTLTSFRTVPVAARCLRALRQVIDGLKVRHPLGYLFATPRRSAPWSAVDYSHAMSRELLACWQATGLDQLRGFEPHWLRATFVSLLRAERVDYRLLQVYIGHAPSDTMGRFYEQVGMERLRGEIVATTEAILARIWQTGVGQSTENVEVT